VLADHELEKSGMEQHGRRWLAVANSHQGLAAIYADSHWKSMSGTSGGWVRQLRRISTTGYDGSLIKASAWSAVRLNGVPARCSLVPLTAVLSADKKGGEGAP